MRKYMYIYYIQNMTLNRGFLMEKLGRGTIF